MSLMCLYFPIVHSAVQLTRCSVWMRQMAPLETQRHRGRETETQGGREREREGERGREREGEREREGGRPMTMR